MSGPPALPPNGYYTRDGRWWWNGTQWVATQPGGPPGIAPRSAFKAGFFGWLGVSTARSVTQCAGCLLFLLLLGIIVAVASTQPH